MTVRERVSLVLVAVGALLVVAAVWALAGWVAAVGVMGALCLIVGGLLGIDADDDPVEFGGPDFTGGEFAGPGPGPGSTDA